MKEPRKNAPGQGRKPSPNPRNKTFNMRLTEAEYLQLKASGGAVWVRAQLVRELKA